LKLSGTTGTHEKGDVPPGFSQTPAKIPASRAGTDDQKTHVFPSCAPYMPGRHDRDGQAAHPPNTPSAGPAAPANMQQSVALPTDKHLQRGE
jgi:hypothetical protein